ncbi:putative enzyme involved in methoxymalonyl-ACP biosynthesis [Flavobacterium sp. 7E]|uniref:hypothetical protein n=1 Tax=Flavobacterium sp. 7E TaxID=2735898 RepID=UPI00156FFA7B|nr:hypothetical protein [Flavobacterium sp. 7E]NRS90904.1 putative enzyme involved in methoxymalonyl-ACP biosynthesis [Flavobacterium sp. 7E]
MKNIKLSITALILATIFLFVSTHSTYEYFDNERRDKIFKKYENFDCNQMKNQFYVDLKNHELKYFFSGYIENQKLRSELKKLGIEDFYQGCVINVHSECYDELLGKYLKKEKNVDLENLWK